MTPKTGKRGWSTLDFAEKDFLRKGPGTLASRCRKLEAYYESVHNALGREGTRLVPASPSRLYHGDHITLEGNTLVLADPHAPYYDARLINDAIWLGKKLNIKICLLAGDIIDATDLSPHRRDVLAQQVGQDLKSGAELVDYLLSEFEVHIILGNHDARVVSKLLEMGLDWANVLGTLGFSDEANVSEYHWCECQGWRITHPDKASIGKARNLAAKYHRNIMMAHSHRVGSGRDISGKYTVIETGGVFHPAMLAYVRTKDNDVYEPNQGFAIIRNGIGHPFDPLNLDWSLWDAVQE